jgi:tetratricopeptide (TPR) repeat protein
MPTILNRLWEIKKNGGYKTRIERLQQKAAGNPQNLIFQVRMGDFLTKLNKTKEAIAVYERAAQEFIRKNLFAQAIALKKIIFRMDPFRDAGDQAVVLGRLYEQMLASKTEAKKIETENLQGTSPPPTSKPLKISQTLGSVMRLEPKATH